MYLMYKLLCKKTKKTNKNTQRMNELSYLKLCSKDNVKGQWRTLPEPQSRFKVWHRRGAIWTFAFVKAWLVIKDGMQIEPLLQYTVCITTYQTLLPNITKKYTHHGGKRPNSKEHETVILFFASYVDAYIQDRRLGSLSSETKTGINTKHSVGLGALY